MARVVVLAVLNDSHYRAGLVLLEVPCISSIAMKKLTPSLMMNNLPISTYSPHCTRWDGIVVIRVGRLVQ